MKRLLLVSYLFPPLAGAGVFRPLRLSKYLPRHGWEVTVLTVSSRVRLLKDPSLLREIDARLRIERTTSIEPRTLFLALNRLGLRRVVSRLQPWLMLPDDQRGWVGPATRRGLRILSDTPHDALLTTAGPYSAHLVGLRLRRAFSIPWIADFRDEWTTNPYLRERYPTRWHRDWNRARERTVLERADRVTCVSEPWLAAIRGQAPGEPFDKFVVMPNGYDGEHFRDGPGPRPERFRVVYTGTFYGHRSPQPFIEAVRRALSSGRIEAGDLEVVLMGHSGAAGGFGDVLRDLPAGVFRVVPQRPYLESLEVMKSAAALLLVVPREGGSGNHTGKLFPYLASGRPILALAPQPNVAAELIHETRSGIVVPPDDVGAIASALERLYRGWRAREAPSGQRRDLVRQYEADCQAQAWARLLEETVRDGVARS